MNFLVNEKNFNSGVSFHRLRTPFLTIHQEYGYGVQFFDKPNEIPEAPYTHLVFNRNFGFGIIDDLTFISNCKKEGLTIVMDIDDYWELPEHHTIRWRKDLIYSEWKKNITSNMALADIFWVSTEEIKTKLTPIANGRPIHVIPNALDTSMDMWQPHDSLWKKDPKRVHVGYVGGTTHYKDLDHIKPAIAKINKYYGKQIKWVQCGYDNKTDYGKRVSTQIENVFTSNGKYKTKGQYMPIGGVHWSQYGRFYDGLDISIAPLHNNSFNECKSDLKVIEAGQKKTAFIGEDLVTYSRSNCEIELASTNEEWFHVLKNYITDRDQLLDYGDELYDDVTRNHVLSRENKKRIDSLL